MAADMTAPAGHAHNGAVAGTSAAHLVMHTAEEAATCSVKVKRSWLERQAVTRKIPFSMLGGSYTAQRPAPRRDRPDERSGTGPGRLETASLGAIACSLPVHQRR
jgi:hypothetical protein